jgi:Leucine Rich repeat
MSCRRLLESLSLDGNSISNIGTVSLCTALLDSRFLRVLSLGGTCFATHLPTYGFVYPFLGRLSDNSGMGQLSGKAIAALLISSNSLQFLSIAGHNNVGDVGLHAIAAALHENVSLKSLDISEIGCTSSGLHRLAAALVENDAITSLNCNGT